MKRLFLASVAATGVSSATFAADMSVSPVKVPPIVMPPPFFNWIGFYVGGNIGGGFNDIDFSNTNTVTGAPTGSNSANIAGVIGGGQIGYNSSILPHLLAGFEADISGADINGTAISPDGSAQHTFNTDLFGTARARFGLTYNNWLFYGSGGFAWGEERVTRNQLTGRTRAAVAGTSETVSTTGTGWAAGGGIEWGFMPNWTARIEYLYVDLGTYCCVFPLAGRTTTSDYAFNVVRFGINYRLSSGP